MVSIINKETFFECDSWVHAQENSCGYDNSELLAFYENINSNSPCPSSSHLLEPRLIELFCAIQRAVRNLGTVSIADVGGANGYLGKHALNFFDLNLKWTVFEQEVFVDLYKKIHNSTAPKTELAIQLKSTCTKIKVKSRRDQHRCCC